MENKFTCTHCNQTLPSTEIGRYLLTEWCNLCEYKEDIKDIVEKCIGKSIVRYEIKMFDIIIDRKLKGLPC
jgi:hypothetical protein